MMPRARPTAALIVLLAGTAALAQERFRDRTPDEWLLAMNRAFTDLTYDGVFSYFNGDDVATLRVVHKIVAGVQRERMVHLNGPPREIVRTGESVDCILLPGDELLALEGSIPAGPFARAFIRQFDSVGDNYAMAFRGEGRIAGRRAVRLAVTPRDENRYGYRIWLDLDTNLLLRSELVGGEQQPLEIFQFTHLHFGPNVNDEALEPENPDGSVVNHLVLANDDAVTVPALSMPWRAGWMPAGFNMAAADIRHTRGALKAINTLMYSDGLAAFSVFIEDMPPKGAASMVSHRGATVMVTELVDGPDSDPVLVTVVGDLPLPTAVRIARSVHYGDG